MRCEMSTRFGVSRFCTCWQSLPTRLNVSNSSCPISIIGSLVVFNAGGNAAVDLNAKFFDLASQRRASDPKYAGGFSLIALRCFQDLSDQLAFDSFNNSVVNI